MNRDALLDMIEQDSGEILVYATCPTVGQLIEVQIPTLSGIENYLASAGVLRLVIWRVPEDEWRLVAQID